MCTHIFFLFCKTVWCGGLLQVASTGVSEPQAPQTEARAADRGSISSRLALRGLNVVADWRESDFTHSTAAHPTGLNYLCFCLPLSTNAVITHLDLDLCLSKCGCNRDFNNLVFDLNALLIYPHAQSQATARAMWKYFISENKVQRK